jgi:hypothetical protein
MRESRCCFCHTAPNCSSSRLVFRSAARAGRSSVADDPCPMTYLYQKTSAILYFRAAVNGKPSILSERAGAARWFASTSAVSCASRMPIFIARGIVELLGVKRGFAPVHSWPTVARHNECSLRHNRENLSRYSIGNRLSTFDFGQSHSAAEGDLPTQSAPGQSH